MSELKKIGGEMKRARLPLNVKVDK